MEHGIFQVLSHSGGVVKGSSGSPSDDSTTPSESRSPTTWGVHFEELRS